MSEVTLYMLRWNESENGGMEGERGWVLLWDEISQGGARRRKAKVTTGREMPVGVQSRSSTAHKYRSSCT